jgi:hypothetical protein
MPSKIDTAAVVAANEWFFLQRNFSFVKFMMIFTSSSFNNEETDRSAYADKVFALMGITPERLSPVFNRLRHVGEFMKTYEELEGVPTRNVEFWQDFANLTKKTVHVWHSPAEHTMGDKIGTFVPQ